MRLVFSKQRFILATYLLLVAAFFVGMMNALEDEVSSTMFFKFCFPFFILNSHFFFVPKENGASSDTKMADGDHTVHIQFCTS